MLLIEPIVCAALFCNLPGEQLISTVEDLKIPVSGAQTFVCNYSVRL